jgi:Ca2+-binding RTX toxin-like protein
LSDTQPITITIEDDIPRIDGVQNLITLNQISEVSGALNFGFGGDGPAAQGALAITRWTDVDGITETLSADGMTLTATFGDSGTVFYTLALKSDGTYTFNLVTPQPTEVIDIGRRFGAGQPVETITIPLGEDKPTVTFNGLLFDSENNPVDLPGSGGANGRDDLNPNNIGFGLGNGNIGDNTGFEATFTAPVNGMVFELVGKAGNVDAAVVFWRAFNADGRLVDSGNIPVSGLNLPGNLPQPVAINSINEFSRIEIRFDLPDSNDGVRVQNFQIIDSLLPADLALNFQVTATDADGDAASATFSVNVVASLPQPESVALPSLAFAAQVGDSSFQTVVINKDTVSSNDQGFVVRAFGLNDKDVPTAAISIRTNSTNSGFGVNEQASGDRVEIGELDGQAQRLEVQFDNPVASAKVQLAWLRGGASPETALVLLFAGASQVGAITLTGLTDTVDNFGSLQANGGALFDRMVFTVPTDNTYAGDDYLIHSIEFTRATQFPVDITVTPSANYAASAVVEVVVEVPTGMALSSGTDNGNGTWTLKPGTDVGYTVTLNSQGSFSLSGLQLSAPGITDAQPEVAVVSASVSDDGGNLLVSGGSGNDQLSGGALNDIMMGGAGNDVLAGGAGNDILTGGEGADVFSWTLADTTADNGGFVDRITDFGNGADVLNIGDLLTPAGSSVSALVDRGNTTLTFTNSDAQVIQTIVLENYAPTDVEAMLNSLRNSGNYNA